MIRPFNARVDIPSLPERMGENRNAPCGLPDDPELEREMASDFGWDEPLGDEDWAEIERARVLSIRPADDGYFPAA